MRSRNQRSWGIAMTQPAYSRRVLERAQRLDVEVVRRLVEEQHVAARHERLREVEPAALAAGERADDLLLIRPLKLKRPMYARLGIS